MSDLGSSLCAQSVLGGLLNNYQLMDEVKSIIGPDDFSNPLDRKIFMAMETLHDLKKPFDILILDEYLKPELPAVDTFSFLAQLAKCVPITKHVPYYAQQLKTESQREALSNSLNNAANMNQSKEPLPEIIDKTQNHLNELSATLGAKTTLTVAQVMATIVNEVSDAFEGITPQKLNTGFKGLDFYLQGLRPGNLAIIAGRPSMGKSTFALNIVQHIIMNEKKPVMIFSFEMSEIEILRSMIASMGHIPLKHLKGEDTPNIDLSRLTWSIGQINNCAIELITTGATIGALKRRARDYVLKHPDCGAIVIDYIQLMSKPKTENRVLEISAITRELKLLAKDLNLPIIALSQLNRNADGRPDKTPILSDLRDSGSIEQDADIVMFVHRVERDAKIVVAKNRSGPCGEARLIFDGSVATFKEQYND